MSSTKSVLGLVRNHAQAQAAIAALLNTGFVRGEIATLQLCRPPSSALLHGLPRPVYTSTAAGVGAGIGTVLGLLVGLGLLSIPGVGPFLVVGPIMAAFGAVFTGAAVGGITGSLLGLGIAEVEAKQYEKKIREGAILVSVSVDDRSQRSHARKVLAGYGATNIATFGEKYAHQSLVPAPAQ